MKRKIALAMAAIMTFAAAIPMGVMNVAAATATHVTVPVYGYENHALVPEATTNTHGASSTVAGTSAIGSRYWYVNGVEKRLDRVASGIGGYLRMVAQNSITTSGEETFTVTLTGAEWAFFKLAADGTLVQSNTTPNRTSATTFNGTIVDAANTPGLVAVAYHTTGGADGQSGGQYGQYQAVKTLVYQGNLASGGGITALSAGSGTTARAKGTTLLNSTYDALVSAGTIGKGAGGTVLESEIPAIAAALDAAFATAGAKTDMGYTNNPAFTGTVTTAVGSDVPAVAGSATLKVDTAATAGDKVTIGSYTYTAVTAGSGSPAGKTFGVGAGANDQAAELVAALNASGEYSGVNITVATDTITFTQVVPGVGFIPTAAATVATPTSLAITFTPGAPASGLAGAKTVATLKTDLGTALASAALFTIDGSAGQVLPATVGPSTDVETVWTNLKAAPYAAYVPGVSSARALSYRIDVDFYQDNPAYIRVTYWTGTAAARVMPEDYIDLPLVMRTTGTGEINATVNQQGNANFGQNLTYKVSGSAKATNASIPGGVADGLNQVELRPLYITESAVGTIANGNFRILAPAGYEWKSSTELAETAIPVGATGGVKLTGVNLGTTLNTGITVTGRTSVPLNASGEPDNTGSASGGTGGVASGTAVMFFKDAGQSYARKDILNITMRDVVTRSTSGGGTLVVSGLVLVPVDEVTNPNTSISIGVDGRNHFDSASGGTNISTTTAVPAARFNKAAINFTVNYNTADKVPWNVWAGFKQYNNNVTNAFDPKTGLGTALMRVTMTEQAPNSWWAERETMFTLTDAEGVPLDGVKFISVKPSTRTNISMLGGGTFSDTTIVNNESKLTAKKNPNFYYNEAGNQVTFSGLTVAANQRATLVLDFAINADVNFEGDVYMTLTSSDYRFISEGYIDNYIQKIATVKPVVSVSTKTTSVQVGAQRIDVADISIAELAKGALIRGKDITLGLGEFSTRKAVDVDFVPITQDQIEIGGDTNLKVSIRKGATVGSSITLDIDRVSTATASSINLKNLQIRVNRSVPYGTYELVVDGTAIRDNYKELTSTDTHLYEKFNTIGIVVPEFVKIGTIAVNTAFSSTIVVQNEPDSKIVLVNGAPVEMTAPIKNINDRLYVPLRLVEQLGAHPVYDIVYDDLTKSISITLNGKTVTWVTGSPIYTLPNGAKVGMPDNAICTNIDGFNYIPFRGIADAFNIPWSWDDSTQIATFNPNRQQ